MVSSVCSERVGKFNAAFFKGFTDHRAANNSTLNVQLHCEELIGDDVVAQHQFESETIALCRRHNDPDFPPVAALVLEEKR